MLSESVGGNHSYCNLSVVAELDYRLLHSAQCKLN